MGRPGGGHSGGGHHGGGHSMGSRSGGGHHVGGSSSRPGGGSSFSFGGSGHGGPRHGGPSYHGFGPMGSGYHGGPGMPPPRRPRGRVYYGGGCGTFIFIFVILFFSVVARSCSGSSYSDGYEMTQSTIEREALTDVPGFMNDCVEDELGWIDSISKTETELKYFYEKTGVQPYVILRDYDSSLTSDEEMDDWAAAYYDANFDEENIFLYVYFADEDVEGEVGYMSYVNGHRTDAVMDSEAVEIFWDHLDNNWYSDMSMDEVIYETFSETADVIMASTTAKYDAQKQKSKTIGIAVGSVALIGLGCGGFYWWKRIQKRKKEEAEETERILNTPLDNLVTEELEKKYEDK